MLLTQTELRNLVEVKYGMPHQLLGMHPLGDGSGIVVRAFIPGAAEVTVVPLRTEAPPPFKLKRLPDACGFEGVAHNAPGVYA